MSSQEILSVSTDDPKFYSGLFILFTFSTHKNNYAIIKITIKTLDIVTHTLMK